MKWRRTQSSRKKGCQRHCTGMFEILRNGHDHGYIGTTTMTRKLGQVDSLGMAMAV